MFRVFVKTPRTEVPPEAKVFRHVWVDVWRGGKLKPRIAMRDLKANTVKQEKRIKAQPQGYSNKEVETVQSPTPSALMKRLKAFIATPMNASACSVLI
eukprot:6467591-Amphidinium_carterae.4